jgi:hypothetical protein
MIQILFRNNVKLEPCKCKLLKLSVPDFCTRYSAVLQSRLTCKTGGKTGITRSVNWLKIKIYKKVVMGIEICLTMSIRTSFLWDHITWFLETICSKIF